MIRDSREFSDVLKEAQVLGYAEADPSADIDGLDVARKTAISSSIAFDTVVSEDGVLTFSLRNIRKSDIDYIAAKCGKTVRYLGYGMRTENGIAAVCESISEYLVYQKQSELILGKTEEWKKELPTEIDYAALDITTESE